MVFRQQYKRLGNRFQEDLPGSQRKKLDGNCWSTGTSFVWGICLGGKRRRRHLQVFGRAKVAKNRWSADQRRCEQRGSRLGRQQRTKHLQMDWIRMGEHPRKTHPNQCRRIWGVGSKCRTRYLLQDRNLR